ncbi:MAG: hypothetical protein ACYC4U_16305 [Pirellulaceae bacterium]|jgi:hypothetical protein
MVLREVREQCTEVQGLGIELVQGILELPPVNLLHEASCRTIVEHRPTTDGSVIRSAFGPTQQKRRRMLGFDNERFQPTRGYDADV